MSIQEDPENGNGGTSTGDVEFSMESEPKTESDLFELAKRLKTHEENSNILTKHQLGKAIIKFYNKNISILSI